MQPKLCSCAACHSRASSALPGCLRPHPAISPLGKGHGYEWNDPQRQEQDVEQFEGEAREDEVGKEGVLRYFARCGPGEGLISPLPLQYTTLRQVYR